MNPYYELYLLRNNNQAEFLKLLLLCIFYHLLMLYTMYALSFLIAPFFILILGMYGEMFIGLFLTQSLHSAWKIRVIQEDESSED